jgi:hypothetical protein
VDLLAEHFQHSPVCLSPTLRVTASDKKYPFHVTNTALSIEINIENSGPGVAFDLSLRTKEVTDAEIQTPNIHVGDFSPTIIRRVPILVALALPRSEILMEIELEWFTFDRQPRTQLYTLEFKAQAAGIDWQSLATTQPYELEPVTTDDELVGRTEILNQLLAMSSGTPMGSAIIYGQKRVGKTSIVKTLKSRLRKTAPDLLVLYVEGGEYAHPDPVRTVKALGDKLVFEILSSDSRFSLITAPTFDDALAPLSDLISAAKRINPLFRVLIILDEFDALHTDLYNRGEIANAFFLTLRSLSAKYFLSFILVGSEKMQAIINFQGHQLNKFTTIRVDYFDRQAHWADFMQLVRKPASHCLEYSDQAITTIYGYTAGNPYFTKMICRSLFKTMVDRRDSHVTSTEVHDATRRELTMVDSNHFVHFWEDGIVDTGAEKDAIIRIRRKTLLSFADAARRSTVVHIREVIECSKEYHLTDDLVKEELGHFVQRQVMTRTEDVYDLKVMFFAEWLKEVGVRQLLSGLDDRIMNVERKASELAYVQHGEISILVDRWVKYRGNPITVEQIRAWLNQFGDNRNQRLMYKILSEAKLYTEEETRICLYKIHVLVSKHTGVRLEGRVARIHDLLVTFLEGPGKSGFQYARVYAEVAKVLQRNVVEPGKCADVVKADPTIKAVLFLDDFLGTGQTAIAHCQALHKALVGMAPRPYKFKILIATISGFEDVRAKVSQVLSDAGIEAEVIVCDPRDDSDKCFSDHSRYFYDSDERGAAMRVARDYGARLVGGTGALGIGNCQSAVIFERGCPNHNLPILWQSSRDWVPLFPRV